MLSTAQLLKATANLPPGGIVMLEAKPEEALQTSIGVLQVLVERYTPIILSATRPYTNIVEICKQNNIAVSKLFFIDFLSKKPFALWRERNVKYLAGVQDLTAMQIAIRETLDMITGNRIVLIDSINSMLMLVAPELFGRFIHSTLTLLRLKGVSAFVIFLSSPGNKELRAEIAQICDVIIKV